MHACRARGAAGSVMLAGMEPIPDDPALLSPANDTGAPLPLYLRRTYSWAYLDRRNLRWLDSQGVVNGILWGNAARLTEAALAAFHPGGRVLQAACVYGRFSRGLAARVGPQGALDVVDVAPLQVANAARKLADLPQVQVRCADLSTPLAARYDGVCCFFLLHEVPPAVRRRIVGNLLAAVQPGGTAVFVDYHRARPLHPLRPLMAMVFRAFEPYAPSLLAVEIRDLAGAAGDGFEWEKQTFFGGLYQRVLARRRAPGGAAAGAGTSG